MASARSWPVLRWVKTKGRAPRTGAPSRAMTAREVTAIGAMSSVLITNESPLTMPPLMWISWLAATSMT